MVKRVIYKLIWCTILYSVESVPRPQPQQANGAVLMDAINLGPSKTLYSPNYPEDIPPQAQKEWRSDADPDGTAIKNFILRVEKTKGRGPPGQFGPGAPGRGPPGRGPPGRGPPGRGPPARGPPARGGGPPGGGGGGGGRGPPGPRRGPPARGGPPAMVDVLNPELASQLAVAQNKANSNNDDFNPGHSPNENFNPNRPNNRNNPPQRPQQQSNSYYDYYDYPKPRPKPKPKVNLKSAPPTEDPALAQRRMDRMAKEAEEAEAIRLRAEQEFKNSLILPSLLLVIGLVILAFVVKNKHKIDAAKAKEAAVKNEEVSGNAPATPADASLESGETSDSEPKTPEDAEKIEEIYKQQPLPAINEDPSEKS